MLKKSVYPSEQVDPEALHGFGSSKKYQTQSLEAGHWADLHSRIPVNVESSSETDVAVHPKR